MKARLFAVVLMIFSVKAVASQKCPVADYEYYKVEYASCASGVTPSYFPQNIIVKGPYYPKYLNQIEFYEGGGVSEVASFPEMVSDNDSEIVCSNTADKKFVHWQSWNHAWDYGVDFHGDRLIYFKYFNGDRCEYSAVKLNYPK